ncbi:hypothetical protein Vadar_017630 [Vaccinium darrowii]|uniref:Uncharacterized protein n=1 Tax=Vaccinium darrowii TaxID=229202 RepID=A0ACB7YMM1_9ERIC|nr:hypothetical protein Vadar_017630 [Vaccinium darrowii]
MYLHALLLLFLSWLRLAQPTLGATNSTANVAAITNNSFFVAKPGCQLYCGNITVPYPFGIGIDCSIGPDFDISCNTSYDPPKAFLGLEVLSITETQVRVRNYVTTQCYNKTGPVTPEYGLGIRVLENAPYTFSYTANKFTVVGCADFGQIVGVFQGQNLSSGCTHYYNKG